MLQKKKKGLKKYGGASDRLSLKVLFLFPGRTPEHPISSEAIQQANSVLTRLRHNLYPGKHKTVSVQPSHVTQSLH